MTSYSDTEDEYLDDPISLVAIEDIKTEYEEDIIDISSSDEEETYTSAYGKKSFVLPVTFFDVSRNIRLLNKCKPMSIKIVDCKQYPTYYCKNEEESRSKSVDSIVEVDNICNSDSKPNTSEESIVISENITAHNVCKKPEAYKPNSDSVQSIVINDSVTIHKNNGNYGEDEIDIINVKNTNDSITVSTCEKQFKSDKLNYDNVQNNVINDNITLHTIYEKQVIGELNIDKLQNDEVVNKQESTSQDNLFYEKVKKPTENNVQNMVTSDLNAVNKLDKERNITYTSNTDSTQSFTSTDDISLHKVNDKQVSEKPDMGEFQRLIDNVSITVNKNGNKLEGKKKRTSRSDLFYEKLKNRKENSKQMALSCKDLKQVNFKRNTGLVGLKITDSIFKQIVNTEKAMTKGKKYVVENNENEKGRKPLQGKYNHTYEGVPKTTYSGEREYNKINCIENKFNDLQMNTDRKVVSTTRIEKEEKVAENTSIKNEINYVDNSCEDKFDIQINKTLIKTSIQSIYEKPDKHVEGVHRNIVEIEKEPQKDSIRNIKVTTKEKSDSSSHIKTALIEKVSEMALREMSIISPNDTSNEEIKSNNYMKNVGTALDNLGTTITPVTDMNTINHASSNIIDNKVNRNIKEPKNAVEDIPGIKNVNDLRCSIKIPSKKIIDKALVLKKITHDSTHSSDISQKIVSQKIPKENKIKEDQALPVYKKKSSKPKVTSAPAVTEKEKLQCNSINKKCNYTHETKPVLKQTNKKQLGSNSPVIPCTTITVRAGPPKLVQNIPSSENKTQRPQNLDIPPLHNHRGRDQITPLPAKEIMKPRNVSNNVQKTSELPKVVTIKESSLSHNSKYLDPVQNNKVAVSQTNVPVMSVANSINNQNSPTDNDINKYPMFKRFIGIKNISNVSNSANKLSDQNMSKPNGPNQGNPPKEINQNHSNLPMNPLNSNISGPNAKPTVKGIILRRPPPPGNFQNKYFPYQGRSIQTMLNHRPQYQPMSFGPPPRFRLPPRPPPPNYAPNGMRFLRPCPSGYRLPIPPPPPPPKYTPQTNPGPPSVQVNKDSIIGNTADGDLIKKINIPAPTNTVNDKHMMLAELNNAMMSPELNSSLTEERISKEFDMKRKVVPEPINPVKPKYSKPCPLSKKITEATDLNTLKIPEKLSPKIGYSPPILPIWTFEESFERLAQNDPRVKKRISGEDTKSHTPSKVKCTARIMRRNTEHNGPHSEKIKLGKAKKISFEDYRRRVTNDVHKVKQYDDGKNFTDDYNQDQGYDSDSTVKL